MRLFVSNLAYTAKPADLLKFFADHGFNPHHVAVNTHKDTGTPRGFGFVELKDRDAAERAIAALDGQEFMGRRLNVLEAREKPARGAKV
jgi:cold-inducible RNA-binding protein